MNFSLGKINISIKGDFALARRMRVLLGLTRTDETATDIDFVFEAALKSWEKGSYVALDNYRIRNDRFRVEERLFAYEVKSDEIPAKVYVARRERGAFRKSKQALNKSWRYFHSHGGRLYLFSLKRFLFYVYMPLLEMTLLKKGATLAHCSGVERNGRAILFSAWGRVGKTSIMGRYMEEGWNFLADDSCIVSPDGVVHIHPVPIHVYKFHEIQNRRLVDRMLQRTSSFDRAMWAFWGGLKRPEKMVRWVGPEKIFGREKIAGKAVAAKVIHLYRRGRGDAFRAEKIAPERLAVLMANTVLDEIKNMVNTSIVVNSCRSDSFVPDIADMYGTLCRLYSDAFARADCYTLAVPEEAVADEIYSFMEERL